MLQGILSWTLPSFVRSAERQAPPSIDELTVNNSPDYLLAYFNLKNGYTSEVLSALESGIPVRFTYEIELHVERMFLDKLLARKVVRRTLSFDSLKGEYRISLGPDNPRVISVRTLEEAESIAGIVNDVKVLPLKNLRRGRDHFLKVRARCEKADSSLPFMRLLEIFSSWGFKTKWHEIRFRY